MAVVASRWALAPRVLAARRCLRRPVKTTVVGCSVIALSLSQWVKCIVRMRLGLAISNVDSFWWIDFEDTLCMCGGQCAHEAGRVDYGFVKLVNLAVTTDQRGGPNRRRLTKWV